MNRISQTVPYQVDTGFSPYSAAEFDKALSDLARFSFTGVELAVAYPARVDPDALLEKTEPHGLAVTTLSTGQIYGLEGISLTDLDADVRRRAQRVICEHIDLSARIGRPPVTVGLIRGNGQNGEPDVLLALLRESMLPIADHAEKRGVNVQLECICRAETRLINTTAEGLGFLASIGDPARVGLLFDVFHSRLEDGDVPAAVRSAGGRIFNVHLADSNRGLPGTGEIDFQAAYEAIMATGYTGAFALETKMVPDKAYVLAHYAESIRRMVAGR